MRLRRRRSDLWERGRLVVGHRNIDRLRTTAADRERNRRSVLGCALFPVAVRSVALGEARMAHAPPARPIRRGRVDLLLPEGQAEGEVRRDPWTKGPWSTLSSSPRDLTTATDNEIGRMKKQASQSIRESPGGLGPRVAGRDENQGRQDRTGDRSRTACGPGLTHALTVDGREELPPCASGDRSGSRNRFSTTTHESLGCPGTYSKLTESSTPSFGEGQLRVERGRRGSQYESGVETFVSL